VAILPSVANTTAGFRKLASFISHHLPAGERLRIGIEATGPYWRPLCHWLRDQHREVVVLNPLKVSALRNYGVRGSKTDRIDSVLVAQALRWEETGPIDEPPYLSLELRHLTRLRAQIVKDRTRLSLRLISNMDGLFPELLPLFSKPISPSTLAVLNVAPTPQRVSALGEEKLITVLKKASRGKLGRERARQIIDAAQRSIGVPSPALEEVLALLLAQIHLLNKQLTTLNQHIQDLYARAGLTLDTLPGVGPVLAAILLGEYGTVNRFNNATQMVAYAGIDPRLRQSGKHQGQVRMSKRGSPFLRHALYLAAQTAARIDVWFNAIYQRQRERGKTHRQALGAVMNRLVHALYVIWRDNRPYQPLTPA
jgi:transposase